MVTLSKLAGDFAVRFGGPQGFVLFERRSCKTLSYPVTDLGGLDAAHAETLVHAGIRSTDHLIEACKSPHGRKVTALKTGLCEEDLLRWANLADLSRVRGIAMQYVELLSAAGVASVKDLKSSKADTLSQQFRQLNHEKQLCKVSPSIAVVRKWIDQAKTIGSKVSVK